MGDEQEARKALESNIIQAYFVLPSNYPQTLNCRMVFLKEPEEIVQSQFANIVRAGLLKETDPLTSQRLVEGSELVIQATQEDRRVANNEWFKIAAPIIAGFFLLISVSTSSGYLMNAVVEEKENRTMEILATSLSPMQIMGGKILALIFVGWTQIFVWGFFPFLAIFFMKPYLPFLQNVTVDWKLFGLILVTALPTFVLISSLMASIGATLTESSEGQQVSTLIILPEMVPFMFLSVIMANPHGALAIGLSFFPLTAAITLLLRMAFTTVPVWQIALSSVILLLSAAVSLWLAGRIFRIGMLRYGKRMSLKDVLRAVSHSAESAREEKTVRG